MGLSCEEVGARFHVSSAWALTIQPSDSLAKWDVVSRHRYFVAVVAKTSEGYYLQRLIVSGSRSELYYSLATLDTTRDVKIIALGTVWYDSGEPSLTVRAEDFDTLSQLACNVIHGLQPDIREAYMEMVNAVVKMEAADRDIIPFPSNN